jgi:hypothetical protein
VDVGCALSKGTLLKEVRSAAHPTWGEMSVLELFRLDGKTALPVVAEVLVMRLPALAEAGADIVGVSKTLEPSGSAIEKVHALGRNAHCCDFATVKRFASLPQP